MDKSTSLKELSVALSKAQSEMPRVVFDSVNPFLKNKFASLGAMIETSRPILAKYGLSITQLPTSLNGSVGVTTVLMHISGEYISDSITMSLAEEKGKSAAQVAGSVITYLRRYSWSSVLGLYADEDVDGQKQERPEPVRVETSASIVTAEWVRNNYPMNSADDKGKLIEAGKIINLLGLSGKPVEVAKKKIDLYRQWRTVGGLEPKDAAAQTIAGHIPEVK